MKQLFVFLTMMLFITTISFGQEVRVEGNLDVTGGIKNGWVDVTGTTSYTATPNVHGIAMYDNGTKTLTLPTITTDTRGQVYIVTNESASGNINVSAVQSIDGIDKIQPGRCAIIIAKTPTRWLVTLIY